MGHRRQLKGTKLARVGYFGERHFPDDHLEPWFRENIAKGQIRFGADQGDQSQMTIWWEVTLDDEEEQILFKLKWEGNPHVFIRTKSVDGKTVFCA